MDTWANTADPDAMLLKFRISSGSALFSKIPGDQMHFTSAISLP